MKALAFFASLLIAAGAPLPQATALPRSGAVSIFVASFGTGAPAQQLRQDLIAALKKDQKIRLVSNATEADAVLTGTGDFWIKGYISLNPRIRYVNSDARPIYSGYLSVELKDHKDETLWSYLATPRPLGPDEVGRNLSQQVTRKLDAAVASMRH